MTSTLNPQAAPVSQGALVPHGALAMICDGRKAVFAENTGTAAKPAFKVEDVLQAAPNPASHEQGSDQPGRTMQAGTERRSAVEIPDLHDQQEQAFLAGAVLRLKELVRQQKTRSLVLVAPPRALAVLRDKLDSDMKALVVTEIDKDYTKHPMAEIERLLASA
jgi:protein required for attachment to host cells